MYCSSVVYRGEVVGTVILGHDGGHSVCSRTRRGRRCRALERLQTRVGVPRGCRVASLVDELTEE
jgi:hypothetical protein